MAAAVFSNLTSCFDVVGPSEKESEGRSDGTYSLPPPCGQELASAEVGVNSRQARVIRKLAVANPSRQSSDPLSPVLTRSRRFGRGGTVLRGGSRTFRGSA